MKTLILLGAILLNSPTMSQDAKLEMYTNENAKKFVTQMVLKFNISAEVFKRIKSSANDGGNSALLSLIHI